jgi:hypothetical protein
MIEAYADYRIRASTIVAVTRRRKRLLTRPRLSSPESAFLATFPMWTGSNYDWARRVPMESEELGFDSYCTILQHSAVPHGVLLRNDGRSTSATYSKGINRHVTSTSVTHLDSRSKSSFASQIAVLSRYGNTSGTSEHEITARKRRSSFARAQKRR